MTITITRNTDMPIGKRLASISSLVEQTPSFWHGVGGEASGASLEEVRNATHAFVQFILSRSIDGCKAQGRRGGI